MAARSFGLCLAALMAVLSIGLADADARRYDPEYFIWASDHQAGSHPARFEATLNGFPTEFSRVTLKLPAGMAGNPLATPTCSRREFFRDAADEYVEALRASGGGEADPEHYFTTSSFRGDADESCRVGSFAIRGAGDRVTAHVRRAYKRLCPSGIWRVVTFVCDVVIAGWNYTAVSRALNEEVLNNLVGDIYNCEIFGPGSQGAKGNFCFEVKAIPDGAVIGARTTLTEHLQWLTGLDVPSTWLRFTCSAHIRAADVGVDADCFVPREFMWLPEYASIAFDGSVGGAAERHLLTLPTTCVTGAAYEWENRDTDLFAKSVRADFYDDGELLEADLWPWSARNHAVDPFLVDSCHRQDFSPELWAEVASWDERLPAMTFVIDQDYGEAHMGEAEITMRGFRLAHDAQVRTCAANAERCPANSRIGHARAFSPLLADDEPLEGDVFLAESPDPEAARFNVRMDLHGLIDLRIQGRVQITRAGNVHAIFDHSGPLGLQEVAISNFEIALEGGRQHGIIERRDPEECSEYLFAGRFEDFNGRPHSSDELLVDETCVGGSVDGGETQWGRLFRNLQEREAERLNDLLKQFQDEGVTAAMHGGTNSYSLNICRVSPQHELCQ